jgi:hypothetical protein
VEIAPAAAVDTMTWSTILSMNYAFACDTEEAAGPVSQDAAKK